MANIAFAPEAPEARIALSEPILEVRDLHFSYTKDKPVLQGVNLQMRPGCFTAILGVNGCGKSTLLSCMDRLLVPERGSITVFGKPLETYSRELRARVITFVPQHAHANRLVVYDAVLMGRHPYLKGAPGPEDLAAVDRVLADLDLTPYALRYVDELSGGEYQKVVLARAFVQEGELLLLDEPTNNLDPANQQQVMGFVRAEIDRRGTAAVAVLHDINLALRFCDDFVLMREGCVIAHGGPEVVTEETVRATYGIEADVIDHKGGKVVIPC